MFADYHSIDVLDSTFTSNGLAVYCWEGRVRFRSSTLAWNAAVSTIPNDGVRRCEEMRFENNTAIAPSAAPLWQPTSRETTARVTAWA